MALLLTACSSSYEGEQRYLASKNGTPLIVPSPLTGNNISHFYDLPSQEKNASVSIEPPVLENKG